MNLVNEDRGKIRLIYYLALLSIVVYLTSKSLLSLFLIPLSFTLLKILDKNFSNLTQIFILISLFILEILFKSYFLTIFTILGIFMGELIIRRYTPFSTILSSQLLLITLLLLQITIFSFLSNDFPNIEKLSIQFKEQLLLYEERFLSHLDNQNLSLTEFLQVKELIKEKINLILQLLPSSLCIISIIYCYLCYRIILLLTKEKKDRVNPIKKYSHWLLPDYLIIGFISSWVLSLILKESNYKYLFAILLNIWYFLQFLYIVVGFSIVSFFLNKFNLPLIIKIISIIILSLSLNIVMFLGIFDTWFDFRKLKRRNL